MRGEGIKYINDLEERVQKLEDIIYQDERQAVLEGLYEENKRYREALEAIAYFRDKEEGEVATRIDVKYIARKALEGEE